MTVQEPGASPRIDSSLIAALAGNFLIRLDSGMVGMLVGLYLADITQLGIMEVSATTFGVISAAYYLTELIGSPIMGAKSDEHGNRALLLVGPFIGMVAALVGSVTVLHSVIHLPIGTVFGVSLLLVALAVARMLQGLAAATSVPSILSYLSERTEGSLKLRGRVMSIFEVTTAVGLLGGPIVGAQLWRLFGPWGFTITMVLFLISAAAFWVVREHPVQRAIQRHARAAQTDPLWRRVGRLLRQRRLLTFAPAWMAVNAVVGIWAAHLIYQMRAGDLTDAQLLTNHFDENTLSLMIGGFGVIVGCGVIAWGFALGRLRELTVMRLSLIGLFGVCLAIFGINHSGGHLAPIVLLIVAAAVSLAIQSGFAPAAITYLARLSAASAQDRGLLMGIYSVVLGLGQASGYLLGGPFADAGGVDGILVLTALLGLVAVISVFILSPREAETTEPVDRVGLGLHA